MVTENLRASPDFELLQPRKHIVALCSCMGDVPAQSKMSNTRGHTGYLACRYCTLNGEYLSGAVRFVGYSKPTHYGALLLSEQSCTVSNCSRCVKLFGCSMAADECLPVRLCLLTLEQAVLEYQHDTLMYCSGGYKQLHHAHLYAYRDVKKLFAGLLGPDLDRFKEADIDPPKALCGRACMKLSVEQQAHRAALADKVQAKTGPPGLDIKHLGSKGTSWFAKELDYILPANFFLVSFAHALLYGLVADFWSALLPSKTGDTNICATNAHNALVLL